MANIFKDYEKDPNFVGPPTPPPGLYDTPAPSSLKNGSNGIWNSIFDNAGSIFGGIGTIIGSWKGTNPATYVDQRQEKDNTATFMVVGVVVILTIVGILFFVKK